MNNYVDELWAIIPARSGSKRVINKNIRLFAGKPLAVWTIEAALKSKSINRVFVSTDSEEYRKIFLEAQCEVPFLRDAVAATDNATAVDVINEFLEKTLSFSKALPKTIVYLQPSSPLRTSLDIDLAFAHFKKMSAEAVVSVGPCLSPPQWTGKLGSNGAMDNFLHRRNIKRSQDLEEYHTLNGALYILDIPSFQINQSLIPLKKVYAYVMDKYSSIDIDEDLEFQFSEFLFKANK